MHQRIMNGSNEAAPILCPSNGSSSAAERTQIHGRFLLDTSLSSILILNASTRHSVTSRIHRNSRVLSYLIFSTRHLNATLEKHEFVEKFNICVRFFAASGSFATPQITRLFTPRENFNERSRTVPLGLQ